AVCTPLCCLLRGWPCVSLFSPYTTLFRSASGILSGFILSYDAEGYASIAAAAEGTAFSSIFSSMTSLLGSLENFYKLIAVILGRSEEHTSELQSRVDLVCRLLREEKKYHS